VEESVLVQAALAGIELDRHYDTLTFELAAVFHPDKYFRKRLGSFKAKMEAVFGKVTMAHDVLTDREKRTEYDAYLNDQQSTRGIEALLNDALEYSKKNPAIDPLLEAAGIKPKSGAAITNKPGSK